MIWVQQLSILKMRFKERLVLQMHALSIFASENGKKVTIHHIYTKLTVRLYIHAQGM